MKGLYQFTPSMVSKINGTYHLHPFELKNVSRYKIFEKRLNGRQ